MRLRNKKTGEIVEAESLDIDTPTEGIVGIPSFDRKGSYHSLAELNAEWEDYEEPKEFWYIDYCGCICNSEEDPVSPVFMLKEIGNRFDTKEEAEKAVEKLKAWKRLKDKGFSIDGWTSDIGDNYYMPSDFVIKLNYNGDHRKSYPDDVFKDLDLLFGGEE